MNNQLLSEETIYKIVDQANQIGHEASINIQVEQALTAMLKITHLYKNEMYRESSWSQTLEIIEKEADYFYDMTGWKGMEHGKNKINLEELLPFHINIQNLLLQTLYALNGKNYQINSQAFNLELIFDRIFASVPKGKDLVPGFGIVMSLELLNAPITFQQQQLEIALDYSQELPDGIRGNQNFLFEIISNGNSDNFFGISNSRWNNLRRHNDLQPCYSCD